MGTSRQGQPPDRVGPTNQVPTATDQGHTWGSPEVCLSLWQLLLPHIPRPGHEALYAQFSRPKALLMHLPGPWGLIQGGKGRQLDSSSSSALIS